MKHEQPIHAVSPIAGLRDSELQQYRDLGYIGPFSLFTDQGIRDVLREWDRTRDVLPWYKGHHFYKGPIVDALTSDAVASRVASILGDDVLLWGSQMIVKRGGEKHRWHVDVETLEWKSVNFWAALRNVTEKATVLLLPGTQRLTVSPQELERTERLDITDTDAVRRAAAARGVDTDVVRVDIPPGTFVLFDGHLWHGSVNDTRRLRSALLAQFSPTSERPRIPRTYSPPIEWDPAPAPCVLVRGRDTSGGANHYVCPVEAPPRRPTILGVRRAVDRFGKRNTVTRAKQAVSVCIVGTGLAADRHLQALRSLGHVEVQISAVGRDAEKVAAWARAKHLAGTFGSLDEALEADTDIVVIATPPTSHASYLDRAMAAGKHVLVEKPAFRTLEELVERLPAIRSYKPAWMVAENSHFSPMQRLVRARIRSGAIGDPLVTTIHRLRRHVPVQRWKSARTESDGALQEGGIHWIRVGLGLANVTRAADLEWVFAAEPGTKTVDNDGDDTAIVCWRTRKGSLGELAHSWGIDAGRMPLQSTVIGTEGAIHFELSGRIAMISKGQGWLGQRPLLPWRELRGREDLSGTQEMWRSFLESVNSGAPVAHTVEEAVADLGTIDAAYRSMRSGARCSLDPRLVNE